MANELNAHRSGGSDASSGFSLGGAATIFAGTLAALLVAGGVHYALHPLHTQPEVTPATPTIPAAELTSLSVPADGTDYALQLTSTASAVALEFATAGEYRVELRALTAEADPFLSLYADGSTTALASNDDAAGTLDAIVGVTVANAGDAYRVEVNAFGETRGPAMLRIVPGSYTGATGVPTSDTTGFPSGEIATLTLGEGVVTQLSGEGVWYRFRPATSGVHSISVRAADESFDTVAFLTPVLAGASAPIAGIDITSLPSTFSSDDEDGLNPRFQRFLVQDADYFLFVKSFDASSAGSIAITAELVGDAAILVAPTSEHDGDMMDHGPEEIEPSHDEVEEEPTNQSKNR